MSIKVCGHRLLIKPYTQEDVDPILKKATDSGFLKEFQIVNSNKAREDKSVDKGTVIEIGPNCWPDSPDKPWCAVGDVVYFTKFAGMVVEDLFIMNDEDIVAVETQ